MRVGIATFQWSNNYGALLQAYALQTYLVKRGHDVKIIDYRPQRKISLFRKWASCNPKRFIRKWEANYKEKLFEEFRSEQLGLTGTVFHCLQELDALAEEYDLLITGSDQVWNPRWLEQYDGMFEFYFLSFGKDNMKRISYAASIGHAHTDSMNKYWQKELAERLLGIDVISVREHSSISLIEALCGRTDAQLVVDPTLLLPKDHYDRMAIAPLKSTGRYVFSYMLHGLEDNARAALYGFSDRSISVVRCDAVKTRIHRGYVLPSPDQWLTYIRDATHVVTNSFHAVVFSLIFHTPFTAVLICGGVGSMNTRITDLLAAAGLSDRIIHPGEQISESLINDPINWDDVDHRLAVFRQSSEDYLERNI